MTRLINASKQQNMKWSETELCINGETYLLWMLLKKVTWYKYANINKAIRKPPIMTNMPHWKEKKKTLSVHLLTESECGKGVCYLLWSRRALAALFYIYLLCWNQRHSASAQKAERSESEAWKEPRPDQSAIGGACLLRTSTGGAQGYHPPWRKFCHSP